MEEAHNSGFRSPRTSLSHHSPIQAVRFLWRGSQSMLEHQRYVGPYSSRNVCPWCSGSKRKRLRGCGFERRRQEHHRIDVSIEHDLYDCRVNMCAEWWQIRHEHTSFSSPVRYPRFRLISAHAVRSSNAAAWRRRSQLSIKSFLYSRVAPKSTRDSCNAI